MNGEWTTRTLDVNTVLRHYDQQDKEANAKAIEVQRAPVLGLLTQTVIRSPLAHWILPVRLRNLDTNDVAFIGVRYSVLNTTSFASALFFLVLLVDLLPINLRGLCLMEDLSSSISSGMLAKSGRG